MDLYTLRFKKKKLKWVIRRRSIRSIQIPLSCLLNLDSVGTMSIQELDVGLFEKSSIDQSDDELQKDFD